MEKLNCGNCNWIFNTGDYYRAEEADKEIDSLRAQLADYKQTFDLIHQAEIRGVEMFVKAHPEYAEKLAHPSTDRLICWLMEKLAEKEREVEKGINLVADLMQKLLDWENLEGSCCPEDWGFEEYIRYLEKQLARYREGFVKAQKAFSRIIREGYRSDIIAMEALRDSIDVIDGNTEAIKAAEGE